MNRLRYRATVVGADHESLIVRPDSRPSNCALCESGRGCGGGLLRAWRTAETVRIYARSPELYKPGTPVMVASDSSAVAKYALLVYGAPLVVFVASASVFQVFLHELLVAALSLGALLVGFALASRYARRLTLRRISWVETG